MSIKENLTYLCEDKGVTFEELSKQTKIDISVLYDINKNSRVPSLITLIKLCNYFECSVDFILGRTNVEEKTSIYEAKNFINNYKKILKKFGTNNFKVCKETGIGRNRIYEWEKGSLPYVTTLITLADYFKIMVSEFLEN